MLRRDFLKYLSGLPFVGTLFATGESVASEGQRTTCDAGDFNGLMCNTTCATKDTSLYIVEWGSGKFHLIHCGCEICQKERQRISNIGASKAECTQLDEDMLIEVLNHGKFKPQPLYLYLTEDSLAAFKKAGILPEYAEIGKDCFGAKIRSYYETP